MSDKLQEITLVNRFGMAVKLLNFGARVSSIQLPINGQNEEMLVTYQQSQDYLTDDFYLGATCGPVANRVAKAQFTIADQVYKLSVNDGENCLHSGEVNVSNSFWDIDNQTLSENYAKFSLKLANLEQGFPGDRTITVEYKLTEDNQLEMNFTGITDKTTPFNMTNHAYFSLGQTSCLSLNLSLASSSFLERFDDGIPTGEVKSITALGTNVRESHTIETIIDNCDYPQVCHDQGVDHCFIMDNSAFEVPKATLCSAKNGITLKVFSDQSCMQVYTGNYLATPFKKHAGVCLECHGFVDAPNQSHFTSINCAPSDVYQSKIVYRFEIK